MCTISGHPVSGGRNAIEHPVSLVLNIFSRRLYVSGGELMSQVLATLRQGVFPTWELKILDICQRASPTAVSAEPFLLIPSWRYHQHLPRSQQSPQYPQRGNAQVLSNTNSSITPHACSALLRRTVAESGRGVDSVLVAPTVPTVVEFHKYGPKSLQNSHVQKIEGLKSTAQDHEAAPIYYGMP